MIFVKLFVVSCLAVACLCFDEKEAKVRTDAIKAKFCEKDAIFADEDIDDVFLCVHHEKKKPKDVKECYNKAFGSVKESDDQRLKACKQEEFMKIYVKVNECYYEKNIGEKDKLIVALGLAPEATVKEILSKERGIEEIEHREVKLACIEDLLKVKRV